MVEEDLFFPGLLADQDDDSDSDTIADVDSVHRMSSSWRNSGSSTAFTDSKSTQDAQYQHSSADSGTLHSFSAEIESRLLLGMGNADSGRARVPSLSSLSTATESIAESYTPPSKEELLVEVNGKPIPPITRSSSIEAIQGTVPRRFHLSDSPAGSRPASRSGQQMKIVAPAPFIPHSLSSPLLGTAVDSPTSAMRAEGIQTPLTSSMDSEDYDYGSQVSTPRPIQTHGTSHSELPTVPNSPSGSVPSPFLLRTLPRPPANPRDHRLLEKIYKEMHGSRFINLSPLSLLANSIGLYFKGTTELVLT